MEIDFKMKLGGLGFSENEAAVYVALLGLGSATNSQIARESKLNRITNFEVLKRLSGRGVVSGFKMKGVTYFGALNPELLIKKHKEGLSTLEEGLVDLVKNKNNLKKPKITTVSTKEGLKQIYEESLLSKSPILTFTNSKEIRGYFGNEYVDNYVRQRVKKGIKVRGFAVNDEVGRNEKEVGIGHLREVTLLPEGKEVRNEIMIFDDKVAMLSTKDEMGVVIKNESISESLKNVFELLWDRYF